MDARLPSLTGTSLPHSFTLVASTSTHERTWLGGTSFMNQWAGVELIPGPPRSFPAFDLFTDALDTV